MAERRFHQWCPVMSGLLHFFLLLSACRADVCEPPDMSSICDLPHMQCTGSTRSLRFARGAMHDQPCCNERLKVCPFTQDSLEKSCEQFCAEGGYVSTAVLIGDLTFGLGLDAATAVCLDPHLLGQVYNETLWEQCRRIGGSIGRIKTAVAGFLKEEHAFAYNVLQYQTALREISAEIAAKLKEEDVIREIFNTPRVKKPDVIKRLYREVFDRKPLKTMLQRSTLHLKEAAINMHRITLANIADFQFFVDRCTTRFPKIEGGFLLDQCTVTGGPCIEQAQAEHVSCCCTVNPAANIIYSQPPAEAPVPSPAPAPARRRLAADPHGDVHDICASAYKESAERIALLKEDMRSRGAQDLYVAFERGLVEKYGRFYVGASTYGEPCACGVAWSVVWAGVASPLFLLSFCINVWLCCGKGGSRTSVYAVK